jgi:hypothetical protein
MHIGGFGELSWRLRENIVLDRSEKKFLIVIYWIKIKVLEIDLLI